MDQSATPVYLHHVKSMLKAYAKKGDKEAAERSFAIITAHQAAGRVSEALLTPLENLEYDSFFTCVFVQIFIPETKLAAFVAGRDRYCCFFTSLGDDLTLNHRPSVQEEGGTHWLLPKLHENNAPANTIGSYMKALQLGCGGQVRYQDVAIPDLPHEINANGLRSGAINTLAVSLPLEIATLTTGHTVSNKISAFFDYVEPNRPYLMCGAVILGGWTSFPWGQCGRGPVPASIDPLLECNNVTSENIENFIDELFHIDFEPPQFLKSGSLRPVLSHACASLIMYYEDRYRSGEMHDVLKNMRDTWALIFKVDPGSAHDTLISTSSLIKVKFEYDNLHLLSPPTQPLSEPVISTIQNMCSLVQKQITTITALEKKLEVTNVGLTHAISRVDSVSQKLEQALTSFESSMLSAAPANSVEPTVKPILSKRPFSSFLVPQVGESKKQRTLANVLASEYFVDSMAKGGNVESNLTSQEKSRAELVMNWFKRMATPEEKKKLLPQKKTGGGGTYLEPEAIRRAIANTLDDLCQSRLEKEFEAYGLEVPKGLRSQDGQGQKKTRRHLKISSLEDRIKELKKGVKLKRGEQAAKNVKIHEGQFQDFRRELEQQSSTAPAPAQATSQQAKSLSSSPSAPSA